MTYIYMTPIYSRTYVGQITSGRLGVHLDDVTGEGALPNQGSAVMADGQQANTGFGNHCICTAGITCMLRYVYMYEIIRL